MQVGRQLPTTLNYLAIQICQYLSIIIVSSNLKVYLDCLHR